jgi:hypothetical protein
VDSQKTRILIWGTAITGKAHADFGPQTDSRTERVSVQSVETLWFSWEVENTTYRKTVGLSSAPTEQTSISPPAHCHGHVRDRSVGDYHGFAKPGDGFTLLVRISIGVYVIPDLGYKSKVG